MKLLGTQIKTISIDDKRTGFEARQERKKAGLSLREISRRMELSAPYICDLELGRRHWSKELSESFNKALRK